MTHHLVRKRGIPVLAWSKSDPAAPWPCTLFVRYSDTRAQASLYLRFSIPIYGFSQDQTFTLIYDADNLVPGVNSIKPATTPLPQDQLDELARNGNPELHVLALVVKQTCPIRCPPSARSLSPKHGFEAPFHILRKIARATEIDVLLDYNWIHTDNRALLDKLIKHPEDLAGLPNDDKYTKQHRRVDWTVFSPADQEEPPSYASASHKRSRQSSPPKYPSPKRILLDPTLFAGSPTEKATTTTQSPSPCPLSPRVPDAPDIQEAVNKAVELHLPMALAHILPNIVISLLAYEPPAASSDPMASLRALLSDRVAAAAKIHLYDAIEYAHDLRNQADGEFEDVIADHKIDIAGIKDDCIEEMNRAINDKLCELKEHAQDIVDDAVEKMQDSALEAYDSIDDKLIAMLDRHDAYLRRQRELSMSDRRNLDEEKCRRGWNTLGDRGQRSISLPL